jgi:hypothetical protein
MRSISPARTVRLGGLRSDASDCRELRLETYVDAVSFQYPRRSGATFADASGSEPSVAADAARPGVAASAVPRDTSPSWQRERERQLALRPACLPSTVPSQYCGEGSRGARDAKITALLSDDHVDPGLPAGVFLLYADRYADRRVLS